MPKKCTSKGMLSGDAAAKNLELTAIGQAAAKYISILAGSIGCSIISDFV